MHVVLFVIYGSIIKPGASIRLCGSIGVTEEVERGDGVGASLKGASLAGLCTIKPGAGHEVESLELCYVVICGPLRG